jgi:hypothetical protein
MNNRAIGLRRLGRIEEAVAEIERASHLEEVGTTNVSQVLNLAAFYCDLGRPNDARRTIERVGPMSGYGRMVLGSVEHCAALQTGDRQAARRALDYLLSHRSDSEALLLAAFVHEGRLDDAARILIGQLDDPKSRGDALDFVQEFREGPELIGSRSLNANHDALMARNDVKAAIESVGRVGMHDVFDNTGIE